MRFITVDCPYHSVVLRFKRSHDLNFWFDNKNLSEMYEKNYFLLRYEIVLLLFVIVETIDFQSTKRIFFVSTFSHIVIFKFFFREANRL